LAEFRDPHELVVAARRAYDAGYRRLDAFTPFPVEGLTEAIGYRRTRLPLLVLAGGLAGGLGGLAMQYWMTAVDYPINIGGRPLASWSAYWVVAFEMTILGASLTAVLGMLGANGLPMPYHPLFNVPEFKLASRDRFFLLVRSSDPHFDADATGGFLRELTSHGVHRVDA
jgi:hypothetical protein